MSEPMTNEREGLAEIAGVLAEHTAPGEILTVFGEAWIVCGCGAKIDLPVVDDKVSKADVDRLHAAHLADALADLLASRDRRVRAEALRYFATTVGDRNARHGLTTEARHFGKTYARLARAMAAGIDDA